MKEIHNNLIKYFIVVLIIFSNQSFGKEFNELFTIYVPIESSSKIESSINSSFNNLIFRISGSNSPSNIWKIINSGSARKDFIISYSIKNIQNQSLLEVKFNQDKIISKFKELSIPIIGYSRPVLLFLIEVGSGLETPYLISQDPKNSIDTIFIDVLDRLSEERGLFLEIPIFDLQDQKVLANTNILSLPKDYITSNYNFDELVEIKLINVGLNEWLFSGDIERSISSELYKKDIENIFLRYVESKISEAFEGLTIDTSNTSTLKIDVRGVNSYEDYKNSKDKLLKLIGITDLEILSFQNNIIRYQADIMGNINSLNRDIQNSSFFIINNSKTSNQLSLVYTK
ncbi:DUF2066 domain-containing protein [Gammaproteobacteria bacterium]|nr:DUF2066 domain-containing protein [Gammaproteobacteria bacterium]